MGVLDNMSEDKIRFTDMHDPSEMRSDALAQAQLAVQKFAEEKEIARHLKTHFDAKFSPNWHCVVGKSFELHVVRGEAPYLFRGSPAVRPPLQVRLDLFHFRFDSASPRVMHSGARALSSAPFFFRRRGQATVSLRGGRPRSSVAGA